MSKLTRLIVIILFSIMYLVPDKSNAQFLPIEGCEIVADGICTGMDNLYNTPCVFTYYEWYLPLGGGALSGITTTNSVRVLWNGPGEQRLGVRMKNNKMDPWIAIEQTFSIANPISVPVIGTSYNCFGKSATLSVSNPESGVSYKWFDTNNNLLGSGLSFNTGQITGSRSYVCKAYLNGDPSCYKESEVSVVVINQPEYKLHSFYSTNEYRKAVVFGERVVSSSGLLNHYWQDGIESYFENRPVVEYPYSKGEVGPIIDDGTTINEPGNYYIRGKNTVSNCWTEASTGYYINVIIKPPKPVVNVVNSYGYSDVALTISNQSHVLQYATYYWVTSLTGTNVTKPFSSNQRLDQRGTYYLRGRDKSGTWGDALTVNIDFPDHPIDRTSIVAVPLNVKSCAGNEAIYNVVTTSTEPIVDVKWSISSGGSIITVPPSDELSPDMFPKLHVVWNGSGSRTVYATVTFSSLTSGPKGNISRTFDIGSAIPADFDLDWTQQCGTANVTLSVSSPVSGLTYDWYGSSGYLGRGTTLPVAVNGPQTFTCRAAVNPGECYKEQSVTVAVATEPLYVLHEPAMQIGYRNTMVHGDKIGSSSASLIHYWQNDATGYSESNVVVEYPYSTGEIGPVDDATFINEPEIYIRAKNIANGCWTSVSNRFNANMILTPPIPVVNVVNSYGYSDVALMISNQSHVLQYATYYWVTSLTGTNVTKPFSSNQRLDQRGAYYLRGRDKSGAWGPTLEVNIDFPDHPIDHTYIVVPLLENTICAGEEAVYDVVSTSAEHIVDVVWSVSSGGTIIPIPPSDELSPDMFPKLHVVWNNDGAHEVYAEVTFSNSASGPKGNISYSETVGFGIPADFDLEWTQQCGTGRVTLSVVEPVEDLVYQWYGTSGLLGEGQNFSVAVNGSGTFICRASLDPEKCYKEQSIDVVTALVPQYTLREFYLNNDYRLTYLYVDKIADMVDYPVTVSHYWQQQAGDTETDRPIVVFPYKDGELAPLPDEGTVINEPRKYFLRGFDSATECWTSASEYWVDVNIFPPQLNVRQTQENGYNLCELTGGNLNHIQSYADYYWVIDPSDKSMDKPFSENNKINKTGTYFLRGRDKLDGVWGKATTISVILRNSNDLNWVAATGYDEYQNPIAQSKTFFDLAGKNLQTQTKSMTSNKIFASQAIQDEYGRSVINTMSAPIVPEEFVYQPNFVEHTAGVKYDHHHLGQPVYSGTEGTLGWYYSSNNTYEDYVPVTQHPYSRTDYYTDGSGGTRMAAAPGEILKMGSGRETWSGQFSAANELEEYLYFRNNYVFPTLGEQPSTLAREAVVAVGRDQNGLFGMAASDRSENTLMAATSGSDKMLHHHRTNVLEDGSLSNFIYFYLLQPATVTLNGAGAEIKNLITDATMNTSSLPAGFYSVVVSSGITTIDYDQSYGDISYNYYDNAGRLVCSISPNGVEQLRAGVAYEQIDKTTYKYNYQGWLLSTTEPDAGTTEYVYRRDGSIRYSQNAKQKIKDLFSYTLYDALGRPIESGEAFVPIKNYPEDPNFIVSSFKSPNMYSSLEQIGPNSLFTNSDTFGYEKFDWVKTHYDSPDPNINSTTNLTLNQDFVMGAVSWTENENIQTWYSYDEQGRVTWMVQKPTALVDHCFKASYEYDFLGNVLQVSYASYKAGNRIDQFHHYYTYDLDKRLSEVYTSLNGDIDKSELSAHPDAEKQVAYTYYLHGPLKRIELGGDLQGIDFVYNINGWLKQINHPSLKAADDPGGDGENGFMGDAFGLILNYYENNMNSLFTAASLVPKSDPGAIHGLPGFENFSAIELAALFPAIRPAHDLNIPAQGLQGYSVDNPMYKDYLQQLRSSQEENQDRD